MKGCIARPKDTDQDCRYEKKTAEEMNMRQIKRRLCANGPKGCPKCVCIDACAYGKAAIRLKMHEGA